jgi:Rrf2 family protein
LLNIAQNGVNTPVPISRIVEEEGLPEDYIEQLLLKLRRSRLIRSMRGVNGGYLLEKSVHAITVKDVLEAVEGEAFEVICGRKRKKEKKSKCCDGGKCVLKDVWVELKGRIETYLASVTIGALAEKRGRR